MCGYFSVLPGGHAGGSCTKQLGASLESGACVWRGRPALSQSNERRKDECPPLLDPPAPPRSSSDGGRRHDSGYEGL
jgi:hypothetical protein